MSNSVEHKFYSEKNFNTLSSVLLETYDESKLPKDYKQLLFSTMENCYSNNIPQNITSRQDRNNYVKSLNMETLKTIVKKIKEKNNLQVMQNPIQNFQRPQSSVAPVDSKRENMSFYGREMIKPIQDSGLYPVSNFNNIPANSSNFITHDVKDSFNKLEQQRTQETERKMGTKVDFTLPKNTKNNINPENRFQEMMKMRNQEDFMNKDEKQTLNRSSIIDGLDEKILEQEQIVDIPMTQSPILSKTITDNVLTDSVSSFVPQQHISNNKSIFYLTLNSKNRDSTYSSSSSNFKLSFKKDEIEEKKINGITIYRTNKKEDIKVPEINFVENAICLDVVLPKTEDILREPYLWLCIEEWGKLNYGTDVPDNAFARLKPMHTLPESSFITFKAHMLEKHTSLPFDNILTFSIKSSDNEKIEINDRFEIKEFKDNYFITDNGVDYKSGDILYLYKKYGDIVRFYPNVFLYDVKSTRSGLSFRMYIDTESNNIEKLGGYNGESNKRPIVPTFLNVDDYFCFSYSKNGTIFNQKYKILNLNNGLVEVKYDGSGRKFVPKSISNIGFINKNNNGYYEEKIRVTKIYGTKIYVDRNFDNNEYFILHKKLQTSFMFRLEYI